MNITNQTNKIKCDIGLCKNLADYTIQPQGVSQSHYIHICKDCLEQLHNLSSKILVPKSPKSVFAKSSKRGQ